VEEMEKCPPCQRGREWWGREQKSEERKSQFEVFLAVLQILLPFLLDIAICKILQTSNG